MIHNWRAYTDYIMVILLGLPLMKIMSCHISDKQGIPRKFEGNEKGYLDPMG